MSHYFAALAIAVGGMLSGYYLWRVVQYYVSLIQCGAYPDTRTLRRALAGAFLAEQVWLGKKPDTDHPRSRLLPFLTALMLSCAFVGLYALLGFSIRSVSLAWACWMLVLLALLDAYCRLLPDALTLPLLWGGMAVAWSEEGFITLDHAFMCSTLTYLGLRSFAGLFKLIRGKDGLGGGDIKLMAAISAWLGWPDVIYVLFAGSVIGLITALVLRGKQKNSDEHSFGPSLILGAFAMAIYELLR